VANENAGFLSNTSWELNGVNTKVVSESDGTKSILAVASGTQATMPSRQACGTWEFEVSGPTGFYQTVIIMSTTKLGTFADTGYNFSFRDNGTILFRRGNGGGATTLITAGGTFSFDTYHKIKITRTSAGLWELFINGVSQGTSSDNTYTTSTWCNLDLDANGKLRNFKFLPYIE